MVRCEIDERSHDQRGVNPFDTTHIQNAAGHAAAQAVHLENLRYRHELVSKRGQFPLSYLGADGRPQWIAKSRRIDAAFDGLQGATVPAEIVCVTSPGLMFEAMQARQGHSTGESWILDQLSFLAGVNRVRHSALGVTRFGRVGSLDDAYRDHGIDADSIVRAALDVIEPRSGYEAVRSSAVSRSATNALPKRCVPAVALILPARLEAHTRCWSSPMP